MDDSATIGSLKQRVRDFCEERDWDQFHTGKDLAIGIITEAAELLELFRFKTNEESASALADSSRREAFTEELADVFFFVLRFAQRLDIDLDNALRQKIELTATRYPVRFSRGRNVKYTELKEGSCDEL